MEEAKSESVSERGGGGGRREGRGEGEKEGKRERGKEGRREGGEEGRREGYFMNAIFYYLSWMMPGFFSVRTATREEITMDAGKPENVNTI